MQVILGAWWPVSMAAMPTTRGRCDGRSADPLRLWAIEPWYLNLFENALTAQFNHRLVAYALLLAVFLGARAPGPLTARSRCTGNLPLLALAVTAAVGPRHLHPTSAGFPRCSASRTRPIGGRFYAHWLSGNLFEDAAVLRVGVRDAEPPFWSFVLVATLYPERQFRASGIWPAGLWAQTSLGLTGLAADMRGFWTRGISVKLFRLALAARMPDHRPEHLAGLLQAYVVTCRA
jgi:hypothetical protein